MNIRDFNLNKNIGHVLPQCYSGVKLELVKLTEQGVRPCYFSSYSRAGFFDSRDPWKTHLLLLSLHF